MENIGTLFKTISPIAQLIGGGGGKGSSGPSQAELDAQQQRADLEERRAEEERKKESQLRLLRGIQGRGGQPTLFQETGTRGLAKKLG